MEYSDLIKKYNIKESDNIKRYENNPILDKTKIPYASELVFNSGVIKYNQEYIMLFRNDYYFEGASITQFHTNMGIARSKDGINFIPEKEPFIKYEDVLAQGYKRFYDPRINLIDGLIYMTFAIDSKNGTMGGIAKINDDFKSYEILSISTPDNRNMVLLPEKINGFYYRLERPMPIYSRSEDEAFDIWISKSPDLKFWGESKVLIDKDDVPYSNSKIGPASNLVKTKYGYLGFFHSVIVDGALGKNGYEGAWKKVYFAGAFLLDLDDPTKVIGISKNPIIIPKEEYETKTGFRNNVIFPCGLILEDDILKIYYGAGDKYSCLATMELEKLIKEII